MRIGAIIQARMGSTRLPGKVLEDICGTSMLARTIQRTQQAVLLDTVVVATTIEERDDAIVAECQALDVHAFRGSEQDVLDRFYETAKHYQLDAIVRITSDCPLIDPTVIDKVVEAYLEQQPDYASNFLVRTYPRGLDTECMSMQTLASTWENAAEPYQRIHVTPYVYENPETYDLLSVTHAQDYHYHRWTVDTVADLELVQEIYQLMDNRDSFTWLDVLAALSQHPELSSVNAEIQQKQLREG